MRSIGLDLGVRKIAFCEVSDGKVIKRCEVKTVDELEPLLGPGTGPAIVAFEACRTAWYVEATLSGWGQAPVMLDTTRVRQLGIGGHGRKTDKIDAEHLARAVERKCLPRAHVLSEERQAMRHEVHVRRFLIETRTRAVNAIRGQLTAEGLRLSICDADVFLRKLQEHPVAERVRDRLAPLVAILLALEKQLVAVDLALEARCRDDKTILQLMTAPGVGPVLATAFVSVIDDAHRFHSAGQVRSYLGLVPAENSSGDRRSLGHITRAGNTYVRTLLTQAGQVILTKCTNVKYADDAICLWARSLLTRIGRPKAVVAIARRLAGVLWAMWKRDVAYDPVRAADASRRGVALHRDELAALASKLDNAKTKLRQRAAKTRSRARKIESTTQP